MINFGSFIADIDKDENVRFEALETIKSYSK
jgi:hypothetical protein